MAQAKMMDPIQILTEIREGFARHRCHTLEDAGRALVWQVLYNAGRHLEGDNFPPIPPSAVGLLQSFAVNQSKDSPTEDFGDVI